MLTNYTTIFKELEDQMENAVFWQTVNEHINSIELIPIAATKTGRIPSDVLFVMLTVILSRILIKCPDHARAQYTELMKHIIDSAVEHSNKE